MYVRDYSNRILSSWNPGFQWSLNVFEDRTVAGTPVILWPGGGKGPFSAWNITKA